MTALNFIPLHIAVLTVSDTRSLDEMRTNRARILPKA